MSNSVVVKEWKKFRRYKDGAEYYGFSKSVFERLAKEAGAIYKVKKASFGATAAHRSKQHDHNKSNNL